MTPKNQNKDSQRLTTQKGAGMDLVGGITVKRDVVRTGPEFRILVTNSHGYDHDFSSSDPIAARTSFEAATMRVQKGVRVCPGCHQEKDRTEFYLKNIRCKRCCSEIDKRRNRKPRTEYHSEYRKGNKEKRKAQDILNGAIRSGSMVRGSRCSRCNKETNVDAHHDDYDKPLDVRWLCRSCHRQHHKQILAHLKEE